MNFYLLRLSYDGSSFFGCAKQPYIRTVQDQLEKVLTKLFNESNIEVVFAGGLIKGCTPLSKHAPLELKIKVNIVVNI